MICQKQATIVRPTRVSFISEEFQRVKAIRKTLIASAATTAMMLGMGAASAAVQNVPAQSAEATNLWFVELASPSTVDGGKLAAVRADKAAFRKAAAAAGVKFKERFAFDKLFNGVSVQMTALEKAKLSRVAGVKGIYPVSVIQAPKPEKTTTAGDVGTAMSGALGMTGADYAQNTLGLSGAGVKVGVIDTGIDVDHPDLDGGTAGFPNSRVAYGYDFVGDAYNADPASPSYNPVPVPDANPDDCGGHGTHVAGIIGANGSVKGVAPNVTFGAYRVFGCAGSTNSDILVAAMERALNDGMNVVNQSLGASFQWPDYPTAKAADSLVKAGVVMVASIGNSGTSGLYAAGAPGVGKKVIGVASYDNVMVEQQRFSAGGSEYGYFASDAGALPTSGTFPLARTGTSASTTDGCSALAAGSLTGQVALIRRGGCTFYQKAFNAQAAGAAAVIIYNNIPGVLSATVAGSPPVTIPVATVSDQVGLALDAQIAAGGATMTWLPGVGSYPNPAGGLISSFSSWGLAADLSLKPNLGAPGGFIKSTYPLELGGYAVLSGTSMSSPHTAGAVALMLEADPKLSPGQVKRNLQNTAVPKVWTGNPATGYIDMVHRQGAGMINIPAAIQSKTAVAPSEIALGESETGPVTQTLTLSNTSNQPKTYVLSHLGALGTGSSSFVVSAYNAPATVSFSAESVTVPAKSKASFDVTITAPAGLPDRGLYGGYIVATAEGGDVVRVPFAGFKGDYQSIPVMTSGGYGFPWLSQLVGSSYYNMNATGAKYTMTGSDIAYFLLHLDHHSRRLDVKIYKQANDKFMGTGSVDTFLPRNSTSTGYYAFSWNGTTNQGVMDDGYYYAKIRVLKALGDPANDAHWETFTTNTIRIKRPVAVE